MRESVIYGLFDPISKDLRYIGRTQDGVRARMMDHLWEAKRGRLQFGVYSWIRSLSSSPIAAILKRCEDPKELPKAEKEIIAHYRSIGCELVNTTPGGIGRIGKHTEETKQKISAAKKGCSGPNLGKVFGESYRESQRKSWLTRKARIGKIIDHLGNVYDTPQDASTRLNLKKYSIYQSLRDGRSLYGYTFNRMMEV